MFQPNPPGLFVPVGIPMKRHLTCQQDPIPGPKKNINYYPCLPPATRTCWSEAQAAWAWWRLQCEHNHADPDCWNRSPSVNKCCPHGSDFHLGE
jgi:hypothetical protein